MAGFIPRLQELAERHGYQLDVSEKVQEFTFGPGGAQAQTIDRWEFANVARTRSVIITEQFAVYQTTKYEAFDDFLPEVLRLMDSIVEAGAKPIITRVGLRYVDAIVPIAPKTWQQYLNPSLHGASSPVLKGALIAHHTIADTNHGRMLVRVTQNRQGMLVPIEMGQMNLLPQRESPGPGPVVTLMDFDHFKEWPKDAKPYQANELSALLWGLKDDLYDVFSKFVTPEALREWQ